MKAFNWLNRIFHHNNANYSHIPQRKGIFSVEAGEENEERMRESAAEHDTEALLLHDVLFNGILAIGTFGHHHPLLPHEGNLCEEEMKFEEEKGEEGKYHEVLGATLVVVARDHKPLSALFNSKSPSGKMKEEMVMEVVVLRGEAEEDVTKLQEKPLLEKQLPEAEEEEVVAEKPRTTLADLFAADALFADGPEKRGSFAGDDTVARILKDTCCADKKQSKKNGEKLQAASAKRRLQRLMKRMMRKKIHPEQLNGGRSCEGTPMMVRGDENVGEGISASTN